MFLDKEIPENPEAIKYIDISNEDCMKIQSLFSLQTELINIDQEIKNVRDNLQINANSEEFTRLASPNISSEHSQRLP